MTTTRRLCALALLLHNLALLLAVPITAAEYKRPRWADADHDGLDTRAEVLTARCKVAELVKGRVRRAICLDAYTGREVATDTAAQSLQVDHVLPAVRAWRSRSWTKAEFREFFNDPVNLVVTRSKTNNDKSALLPHQWCPAVVSARMSTATRYEQTAARYRISLSPEELAGLAAWRRLECYPGSKVLGN